MSNDDIMFFGNNSTPQAASLDEIRRLMDKLIVEQRMAELDEKVALKTLLTMLCHYLGDGNLAEGTISNPRRPLPRDGVRFSTRWRAGRLAP